MNITPDDPRLTALALDELPFEEARALREQVEGTPELEAKLAETSALVKLLGESLNGSALTLGVERRDEVLRSGQRPDADLLVLEGKKRNRRHTLRVIAGVAAVVALGVFSLNQMRVPTGPASVVEGSGEGTAANQAPSLIEGVQRPSGEIVVVEGVTNLAMPLGAHQSLDQEKIRRWLYAEKAGLPSELNSSLSWINAVSPDAESQLVVDGLGLSAELGECSWNSQKKVLLVSIQSLREKGDAAHSIKGLLELNSQQVASVKLLSDGAASVVGKQFSSLPAGECRLLAYELALVSSKDRPGAIHLDTILRSGDEQSAYLPIPEASENEPSDVFKKVMVMAEFSLWNQNSGTVEELESITNRARSFYTTGDHPEMKEALDLILLTGELVR